MWFTPLQHPFCKIISPSYKLFELVWMLLWFTLSNSMSIDKSNTSFKIPLLLFNWKSSFLHFSRNSGRWSFSQIQILFQDLFKLQIHKLDFKFIIHNLLRWLHLAYHCIWIQMPYPIVEKPLHVFVGVSAFLRAKNTHCTKSSLLTFHFLLINV
jgi:hypothetical protein